MARGHVITPPIVEPKPGRPEITRLIHDRRVLNELLEKLPIQMERFGTSSKLCANGTLWFIDLPSAYSHAEVNLSLSSLYWLQAHVHNCLTFVLRTSA